MSLRLIYGRAGSGKSYFCMNDIKARLKEEGNIPLVLLVPEQFSLQAEKNLIKTVGAGGIMRAEVLSFRRMAYRVFNEVGGITRQHMNTAGKCMLIYRIISTMKDRFRIFSKAAGQKGFVNTLSTVISELKRYNITPEILENAGGSMREDEFLREKLAEINSIYVEFEKALQEGYMDSDDELTLLASKLAGASKFDGAEVWIDEFSGFTPQEYRVIGELLKKAARVNICLCTDCVQESEQIDETDIFSPVKSTAKKLLKIAGEVNAAVESPVVLDKKPSYRFKDSLELMHLEGQMFSWPYKTYNHSTKDISIFSAINIYSEVEAAARDIVRLSRENGMRYRDIAVVTGNLHGYEKLVGVIFEEYGIPYFIDRKRNIDSHPLIQLVKSVLEIFSANWSYEAVFRYLKTGLAGIERKDTDLIENYVLACGIKGGRWTQPEDWSWRMESGFDVGSTSLYEQEVLQKVNSIRRIIVEPLMDFRSKTRGRKKVREICIALFEFLCSLGIPERIEEKVGLLRQAGELNLANEYGQVWNILIEVFDQAVEVMGDETMGLERFSEVLEVGLGEYSIGLIPPALDQVLVGSVDRSRSHEIKALYILGVNDGVFPSSGREEGVLSDRDRESLRAAGLEISPDSKSKAFEEQHLVYAAITTAGRYLRLSYPIADHEGRTMRPSIIISKIKRVFPHICEYSNIVSRNTDDETLQLVVSQPPTFNQLLSAVRRHAEGFEVSSIWWDVYRWYISSKHWRDKCSTALSGLMYTNQVKPVNPDKVKKLYGSPMYSSISRMEKFISCPFAYYVQYGLKAKERKVFRMGAPDIGTFMHAVLDSFSRRMDDEGLTWRNLGRDECEYMVSDIVDQLLESMPGSVMNSSQRYRHLIGRLKRVLSKALWLISEHFRRSGFEPVGYEMEFGEGKDFPPITIELPGEEKVVLTGRIDRIDAMNSEEGTYFRIIDYKSGSKAFKLSDVYYGLQIQLITYLDAVWENGGEKIQKPALPGGMLYFRLDDPIIKGGRNLSEDDIEKAVMKQLKMKGLLLADVKLVKEMDRQIDGDSLIIPARVNKGDVLGRSSAASMEQFDMLRKHVKKLLVNIGEEILKGDVSIKPYKNKRVTSCTYCEYISVCQFDPGLKDNKYRVLNDRKDEEVWEEIKRVEGV